jgi:hypothetical protein
MLSRVFSLALPLLLAAGVADAGFASRLQQGNWSGGVWVDDKTGEFRNCGLGLKFAGGTEITLVFPANLNVALIVSDPRIALTPQQRFQTTVKVDEAAERTGSALALTANMAQIVGATLGADYDALRGAKRIGVAVPGLATTLDVSGIDKALPKLLECVIAERAKMKPPAAGPSPVDEAITTEAGLIGLAAAEKVGAPYIVFANGKRPPGFDRPITLWGHPGAPGPDGPANIMGMTFWNPPQQNDGAEARREARKALLRQACADGSLQIGDLPGLDGRADSFGIGFICQNKYEEVYYVPRRRGGWYEIGLNSPPGKRKTLEAIGARYRAALGALLP